MINILKDIEQVPEFGKLKSYLIDSGPFAIAVSGGVDSMTLAHFAHQLNGQTQMFHARSPAVPEAAFRRVEDHANRHGWHLTVLDAGEMQDQNYLANPKNRCYFCKSNLYTTLTRVATLPIASGTNYDDLSDYRPGLIAASENQVHHPYVEATMPKSLVRELASKLGLDDLKDLPAAPCLSSRVTTGIAIDQSVLRLIDQVESMLRQQWGAEIENIRCRIRPEEIAIEIDQAAINPTSTKQIKAQVKPLLATSTFNQNIQITIAPYKMGSAFLLESINIE